jgi:two-component system chemotaxis sensor kinase CheA
MSLNNEALQQQLINDLIVESGEGLDRFDAEMLLLEKGAGKKDSLNIVFRAIHTIKGTAGCIGLSKIESVAHVGENLLSLLRDGKLKILPPMISTLLEYSDALKEMMRSLEQTGTPGDTDYSDLLTKLQQFAAGENPVAEKKPELTPEPAPTPVSEQENPVLTVASVAGVSGAWGLFSDEPAVVEAVPPVAPVVDKNEQPAWGLFAEESAAPAAVVQAAQPSPVVEVAAPAENLTVSVKNSAASVAETAIRVDVSQLDKLMNLVGELVLARNQILQFTSESKEPTLLNASQRLNIITTELQESVMKTRMQPIENVWAKFPRIVRDVSRELGKKVQLVMEGSDTELDRTIIEAIKDPLTHILRNSIDHGFEKPEVRVKNGKAEEGLLVLRAFHEGGQVNIEIMDDGAGINVTRVKNKAIEKGLVSAEHAARMSDREAFNMIFLPGFSTAEKVTNVSGRGVGMDVVKTNIEKIGGSVDVFSETGQGTTLKIKIPLTLAIIPALIVTSGGERFAIPQVSLLELLRLDGELAKQGIEMIYGSPVYRLRGQLLPLIYLNRELKLGEPKLDDAVQIVVLQADGRQFGMIVDAINDTEEIVVKPLGKQLKGISCFAGATIMGDGKVALILDVLGIAQFSKVISEVRDRAAIEKEKNFELGGAKQTLLVFNTGKNSRLAIPLSTVARLEEFSRASVESSGGQEVVQYRGQILPLIPVARFLSPADAATGCADPMQVVVYSEQGRSVGLVVGKINDIVEEAISVQRESKRNGIAGSVVIQNRVTDLLDVPGIIRAADPSFYEKR